MAPFAATTLPGRKSVWIYYTLFQSCLHADPFAGQDGQDLKGGSSMKPNQQGISNRETASEETVERDVLAREDDITRDRAGHLDHESGGEVLQREADERAQAPEDDDKRGKDWRRSRAGG